MVVKKHRRIEDIERELPIRLRREPKPGDNPLKRPYPRHAEDIEILSELLSQLHKDQDTEYEFSKRDLRIPIRPHGVLFFHVLDIQTLTLSTNNFVRGSPYCIYVELECQDVVKCSDPVYSVDFEKVRIDHSIHMALELSEIRIDESNDFLIHIYAFQDPEVHYLIGSQIIHIYEFVREIHGISTVQLINELSFKVAKVTFEFAWAYGSFGYGFSSQLRNTKNGIFESVNHSMFPRIALSPDDLVDNRVNARVPKKLRLVTLHSLLVRRGKGKVGEMEKAAIQTKKSKHKKKSKADYEAKTVVFRRVKFSRGSPVHVSLNLDIHQKFMEDDFNHAYGEYLCLRNRKDRLEWLTRITEGRLRDRIEYDVGELFMPFPDVQEARRVLTTKRPSACPPAYLEHNLGIRKLCHPINPNKADDEDIKFIHEKLASAPRFSGYLAYVFGYVKPPPKEKDLETFKYKLDPAAHIECGQIIKDKRSSCRKCCQRFSTCMYEFKNWLLSILDFLFPSFERPKENELPELSLTLPSPQHSTTDFHSFCTQKQVFNNETDLEQTRRRATTYLQMSRKKRSEEIDADEEDEYVIPSRAFIGETRTPGERKTRDIRVLEHAEQLDVKKGGVRDANPNPYRRPDKK